MERFTTTLDSTKETPETTLLDQIRNWSSYLNGEGNHRGEYDVNTIAAEKIIKLYNELTSKGYKLTQNDIGNIDYANKMLSVYKPKTERPEDIFGDYEN